MQATPTSAIQMILDTRETRLAEILTEQGIPFQIAPLDVGDLLIQQADGTPLLVAERKTHADLAASNQDGRYREQRARLMAVRGSGVAVVYLLEGTWGSNDMHMVGGSRTTVATLKRLVTRLSLRYGLPVIATFSLLDTARWCRLLMTQLSDDVTVFQPESELATLSAMSSFTAALHVVKKGNKTAEGTAQAMLSAIPGLGAKRVAALLETRSLKELVQMDAASLASVVAGGKKLGAKLAETMIGAFEAKPAA